MAKKNNTENTPVLMAVTLILVAITGSVVVLAAQKYNEVVELEKQAEVEAEYSLLQLKRGGSVNAVQ